MEITPEMDKRTKLRVLMELHDLSSADIAVMLGVSVYSINSYRSRSGLVMPDNLMELLEYKLADDEE